VFAFLFVSRVVYISAYCLQQNVFELDSTTQQLRHWNCLFLAAHREHAIPCGANVITYSFLRVSGHPSPWSAQETSKSGQLSIFCAGKAQNATSSQRVHDK
jgi:hypothetical protein